MEWQAAVTVGESLRTMLITTRIVFMLKIKKMELIYLVIFCQIRRLAGVGDGLKELLNWSWSWRKQEKILWGQVENVPLYFTATSKMLGHSWKILVRLSLGCLVIYTVTTSFRNFRSQMTHWSGVVGPVMYVYGNGSRLLASAHQVLILLLLHHHNSI